jgi:hypothetical protein
MSGFVCWDYFLYVLSSGVLTLNCLYQQSLLVMEVPFTTVSWRAVDEVWFYIGPVEGKKHQFKKVYILEQQTWSSNLYCVFYREYFLMWKISQHCAGHPSSRTLLLWCVALLLLKTPRAIDNLLIRNIPCILTP